PPLTLATYPPSLHDALPIFALALSATMGVAFSANLFTLFLFYEALTLATFPLVGHKETAEAVAGARTYVVYLLGAAKLFLVTALDRKSTRLNSSHEWISYAV